MLPSLLFVGVLFSQVDGKPAAAPAEKLVYFGHGTLTVNAPGDCLVDVDGKALFLGFPGKSELTVGIICLDDADRGADHVREMAKAKGLAALEKKGRVVLRVPLAEKDESVVSTTLVGFPRLTAIATVIIPKGETKNPEVVKLLETTLPAIVDSMQLAPEPTKIPLEKIDAKWRKVVIAKGKHSIRVPPDYRVGEEDGGETTRLLPPGDNPKFVFRFSVPKHDEKFKAGEIDQFIYQFAGDKRMPLFRQGKRLLSKEILRDADEKGVTEMWCIGLDKSLVLMSLAYPKDLEKNEEIGAAREKMTPRLLAGLQPGEPPLTPKVVRPDNPDIFLMKEKDKTMNQAMAKARQTMPDFQKAFEKPGKDQDSFSIKVAFKEDGKTEHMWVSNLKLDGKKWKGELGNEPDFIMSLKLGQAVEFTVEQVSDWMYVERGRLVGGFTLRVIRDKMNAEDRAKFDKDLGLRID